MWPSEGTCRLERLTADQAELWLPLQRLTMRVDCSPTLMGNREAEPPEAGYARKGRPNQINSLCPATLRNLDS